MFDPMAKILTAETLPAFREGLKLENRRLVLTNGCFDILHRGHVDYLCRARNAGDALIVLINSDRSVRQLKGPSRPVNAELDRAFVLAGLACVDAVFVFDEERCTRWIRLLTPEYYAKGADYTMETLNPEERAALEDTRAEVIFIPFVSGFSTTGTIGKLSES